MNPVVENLERELLTPFREMAENLSSQFPQLKANVHSQSVGSPTEYSGHQIVIDCLLADAPGDRPDNVALSVSLYQLAANPKINADVCWGHPSGYVEAEFSPEPLEVSDKVLNDLRAALTRLCESLSKAIRRGRPSG